jgi:hypothetical protein
VMPDHTSDCSASNGMTHYRAPKASYCSAFYGAAFFRVRVRVSGKTCAANSKRHETKNRNDFFHTNYKSKRQTSAINTSKIEALLTTHSARSFQFLKALIV